MTLPSPDASSTLATLRQHAEATRELKMLDLFQQQPTRFEQFSLQAAGLFLDYSKNRIDETTLNLLLDLARERGVESRRDAMFSGEKINRTEQRAVLHTALRAPAATPLLIDGVDVNQQVHAVLQRIDRFTQRVRDGDWRGFDGRHITDIVNIGIGGSNLGPAMACDALRCYRHPRLRMHFVANVDGHDLDAVLAQVQAPTTLFIIASKTFTTAETMLNARSARDWLLRHTDAANLPLHFVAVSTNTDAVREFGIDPDKMFPFWDWVGGRYSIWSAIGLPLALAIGFSAFQEFLAGAQQMDRHFQQAPLRQNMPVLLALIGFWYRNFFGAASLSIAPYHQDLKQFPAYLQQLEMESNGKRVDLNGQALTQASCPVIWGDVGTNGQHAYFQLLHQGTELIPVDFITALQAQHELAGHHTALLANCFAQSEALMCGKDAEQVRAELTQQGIDAQRIDSLLPHKIFPGNRPSNTILMQQLTPATLGALIALYEHKVLVQGVLWNVNSFDQWGVELGKVLAQRIEAELTGAPAAPHDGSTAGLIARAKAVF